MRLPHPKGECPDCKKRPLPPHGPVRDWQTTFGVVKEKLSSAPALANLEEMPPRIETPSHAPADAFTFTVSHVPGKSLITADTLSRAPVAQQDDQNCTEEEIDLVRSICMASIPASNTQLEQIREKQEEDEVCRTLKQYCSEGWPDRTRVPDALKPYWQTNDELSIVHGLLLKGERIVITTSIRLEMLDRIHEGHQGAEKERNGHCGGQVLVAN